MQARRVHTATVVTQSMPLANTTGMSDEERDLIDRWYAGRMRERAAESEREP
jgi:uncharacterized membrane protein